MRGLPAPSTASVSCRARGHVPPAPQPCRSRVVGSAQLPGGRSGGTVGPVSLQGRVTAERVTGATRCPRLIPTNRPTELASTIPMA